MSEFSFAPTGNQTMSSGEIDRMIRDARMAPKNKSPRVLGIHLHDQMRAKNLGYPKDMYHPTMDMRQALNEEEETALAQVGFRAGYTHKEFPKTLFRRNMDEKYAPKFDLATKAQVNIEYVEEIRVRDAAHEEQLRKEKRKPSVKSDWCDKITDLPELAGGPEEDPLVTIARLQGQIAGMTPKPAGK